MKQKLITGLTCALGTSMGIVGTATQTNELLQTISLVVTIVGAVISMIVVPLLGWWNKANKDGKITTEELEEGAKTLQQGIEGVKEETKKGK